MSLLKAVGIAISVSCMLGGIFGKGGVRSCSVLRVGGIWISCWGMTLVYCREGIWCFVVGGCWKMTDKLAIRSHRGLDRGAFRGVWSLFPTTEIDNQAYSHRFKNID